MTSCLLHLTLIGGLWFVGVFEVAATEARPRQIASEESAIRIRFVPRWTPAPRTERTEGVPTERPLPDLAPPPERAMRPRGSIGPAPGVETPTERSRDFLPPIAAYPETGAAVGGRVSRATPMPPQVMPPPRPASASVLSRSAPTRIDRVDPEYPKRCIERRHEGVVDLVVTIDEEGRVTAARVTQESGCRDLDAAARAAALRLRYEPARENGRPVEGEAPLRVRFVLEDPS